MITDLVAMLERINKLPLTTEERAELMRAAVADARQNGVDVQRPRNKQPKVAVRVKNAMREGEWMRVSEIGRQLNIKSSPVASALQDLIVRGEVERKASDTGERAPNGRILHYYRLVENQEGE